MLKPTYPSSSGYEYVRKDKNRHGTTFYRFRWKRQVEYVFTEPYDSKEFKAKHQELKLKVESIKAGLVLEEAQKAPVIELAKSKTFRWLVQQFEKSSAFNTKTKATEKTKTRTKQILEQCCEEPIKSSDPNGPKFGDYPLTGPRAMKLSDLEILRDRAVPKKKVHLANGKVRTIGGPGAADMRVKKLRRLFEWAVKHPEKTHVENDIAAHLDYINEDTGGHHTWTTEELEAFERRHPIGSKARLAFDIFQYVGCRISDAIKLGPKNVKDDVDKYGKPVKVCRFNTTKKKGGRFVGVEVSLGMCQALLNSIAACNQVGEEAWLVTEYGIPFSSETSFGNKFRDWVKEAGLPVGDRNKGTKGCSPHGIRKSVACRLAEKEVPHQTAMALLGWLTFKEYDRYSREANRRKMGTAGAELMAKA